jgi:hypothetical protein
MAGLNHLSEIYKNKGKKFVDDLFSNEITVTENLDGPSFSFEKHYTDDGISFYKKNQENPITIVDRILMTYYEKPINYINSLPDDIKKDLPKGWRFGLVYFPNKNPVRIEYDRIPKNHLILTHITIRDEFGEVTETIQDKETLEEWAERIGVDKPPFIFQGRLSDPQKMEIMDFLSTPLDELSKKFKTESFSKYLISILNPEMSETSLGNSLESQIESLVFRFGSPDEDSEDVVLAKMVDPVFREMSRNKKRTTQSSYFPSDIYSLCLTEVMNFILEKGIESFEVDGIEPEERYISFVFDLFKKFIREEGDRYRGADFDKPEYLKGENFSINTDLIVDKEVVSLIEEDESFSDIFQMILNSFRKFKRKAYGFFTEGLIEQFNSLVSEIAAYINAKKKENLEESFALPTFSRFKKLYKDFNIYEDDDEITEKEEIDEVKSDDELSLLLESESSEENTSEFFSFKNFKKVVSTHKEKRKTKILNESSENVNLIIGKFQPFNNGHYKMCNRVKKENDLPIFLCVVHPGNTNDRYPFSKDLIKKSVSGVVSDNPDLFAGFEMVDDNLLESSVKKICEKYNTMSVTVGEDDFENAVLQREWIREKYDLGESNIEIYKTPRWTDNNNVRLSVMDDDFSSFKSKVPKNVAMLFNEYVREMEENKKEDE